MKICAHIILALSALACLDSPAALAQDSGEMKPVAIIAASSYNDLIADIDHLGELGGQPNSGQQIEGMLNLFTQGQGLQGLDKGKVWGAVVQTDGFQFTPVVCLPVTDLSKIMALVQNFGMTASDVGDGITEIESPNQSIYVKEQAGWAFVAQTPEMLAQTPENPAAQFEKLTEEYDVAVRIMLQNVPEMYRSIAIEQMRAGAEQGLERQPGEDDEAYEARRKMTEANIDQIVQVMQELDEITFGFNIDAESGNAYLDFVYSALPETQAAMALSAYRAAKTNFAGCMNDQAAIRFNMTVDTPPEMLAEQKEQMEAQMESLRQQAMNAIDQEADLPDEESRETLKSAVGDLLDALKATAMSGRFDLAGHVDIRPASLSIVAGGHALETEKIESAAKQLATLAEKDPNFTGVNWNAESHAGASIHTMSIPVPEDKEEAREILGESLDIALALGDEVVYFAAGQDYISNLKQAMDGPSSASVKPVQFTVALQPIVAMILANDRSGNPALGAMAEALAVSEGLDEVHITMESLGDELRARIELEKGVLKAIGEAVGAKRRAGAGAEF